MSLRAGASRLRRLLDSARTSVREFGLFAGALYLVDQALRQVSPRLGFELYDLMAQPVTGAPLLSERLVRNLEFREIRSGDSDVALLPVAKEVIDFRYGQNAICLGGYQKGVLICYIWFCLGSYDEDEVRCTYVPPEGDDSAFDFDLYVFPEKRMGIGFLGIWHGANRYLIERGVRVTYSRMTRFNVLSRRSHARLGAKRIGSALFFQCYKLQLMIADLPPFVSISLEGRPELHLVGGQPARKSPRR